MGPAIVGVLSIACIVALVAVLHGYETAIIIGFILLLSSTNLFHNQNARNYSYAFFFVSIALLSSALAWKKNSFFWGAWAGLFSAIAGLTHNFAIVLPMGLTLFVVFEKILGKNPLARRAILGYLGVGLPSLLASYGFVFWTLHHFKAVASFWSYSPLHALLGLIYDLEYSFVLMAILGGLLALSPKSEPLDRLWLSVSCAIVAVTSIIPFFLAFRPDYVFPATLAILLLAARALAQIYYKIQASQPWFARAFVVIYLLSAMPSFISYYQDGYRFDFRSAAQFITANYQKEDRIASSMAGLLQHYLPPGSATVEPAYEFFHGRQEGLKMDGKRIWLVFQLGREGLKDNVDKWLWENGVRMKRIQKKRFTYHIISTEIYLIQAKTFSDK